MTSVYVIGSLTNPAVPEIAALLRSGCDVDVFDDWYAAGPEADDRWRDYEKARGRSYIDAVKHGHAARHVFDFDKAHLDAATLGVLVLPAGRSGHLELGYLIGQGKPGIILLDDPERWDVMYRFATDVVSTTTELIDAVGRELRRLE